MNILFIGPYRQGDGWGKSSQDYLRALSYTSHNIIARPIFMSSNIEENIPNDLLKLEQKYCEPDIVIQNVLPHLMDYQPNVVNIGLCYCETSNIEHTGWLEQLNLMDEIWVATKKEQEELEPLLDIPVNIIPTPANLDFIDSIEDKLDLPIDKDDFIFYFIGEYVPRKNIQALIKAFHREFYVTEPVSLILKLGPPQLQKQIGIDIQNIKTIMRLHTQPYGYKQEIVITTPLTDEQIIQLHRLGNCLVQPSYGESLSRPVIDAMYCGNIVITTEYTGMDDAVGELGLKCQSWFEPCYNAQPPLPNIYTSYELVQNIDILELQYLMRQSYEDYKYDKEKQRQFIKNNFSYSAVASKIDATMEAFEKDFLEGF